MADGNASVQDIPTYRTPCFYSDKLKCFFTPDQWMTLSEVLRMTVGFFRTASPITVEEICDGVIRDGKKVSVGTGQDAKSVRSHLDFFAKVGIVSTSPGRRNKKIYTIAIDINEIDLEALKLPYEERQSKKKKQTEAATIARKNKQEQPSTPPSNGRVQDEVTSPSNGRVQSPLNGRVGEGRTPPLNGPSTPPSNGRVIYIEPKRTKGGGSSSNVVHTAATEEIKIGEDDPLYLAVISKCDQRQDEHNRILAIRFLSEKQISLKRFCSFVEWFSRDVWPDKPPLLGQIKKYWPEFEAYEQKLADQERRRVAAEEKQAQRERETREQIRAELPIARAAAEEWIRNQRQGELAQDLQRQQEILDDRKASLRNIHAPQSVIDGLRLDMTLDEWCSLSKPLTRAFMEKTYNVPPLSAVAQ